VERRVINPWDWQDEFAYVQGVEVTGVARTVYLAGQTSVDSDGKPLHVGDMRAQFGQALDNLETVLTHAGMDLSHVVRLNIYTTDVDAAFAAYDVPAGRLREAQCRQAGVILGVSRLAYPELLVELEATAVV
jgi:enamine deaminase RidA (YjgF/YER057c/UK114 family)